MTKQEALKALEVLNDLNVESNKRLEAKNEAIQQIEYNFHQRKEYEDKLRSVAPKIVTALAKMHLEITEIRSRKTGMESDWTDDDYLNVSITATSPNNKFKWIKFQGYKASGAGVNEKSLRSKSQKIEEKLSNETGIDNFQINQYSLESKDGKEGRVLITFWIK